MTLAQVESNLNNLIDNFNPDTFIYDFLLAYDTPKSVIARLKKGQLNLSKNADEIIWKKKLFYKVVSKAELQAVSEGITKDLRVNKNQIRFIMVTDYKTIIAIDTKTTERIETPIIDLLNHATFFLPLAGMETYTAPVENEADVKAAVQMAKLFDEIKKSNPTETAEQVHNLNIFLSRLLFCFFAEDTGIFTKNLFTGSISNHTQQDGTDLGLYLTQLFDVLNLEERSSQTPSYLKVFPYVNGGLFKTKIPLPAFTFKSRNAIISSGGENWADINPDIFGSMIQAVVSPDKRGSLGMHYTSVPNIMKVIKPLFLDELYEEFDAAKNNPASLNKLLGRIANIRVFDPACGSGNFLIIAYKELRYLEIQILLKLKGGQVTTGLTGFEERQQQLFVKKQLSLADSKQQGAQMELFSRIELNHFFGIELDDFAHEVAKLSLWLAQHQMNVEFNKLIGTKTNTLPLRDAGIIVQGNAIRLNWEIVCPKPRVGEVFILGNPPYLGSKNLSDNQRSDVFSVFGKFGKTLDYISPWFMLAANYASGFEVKFAFVTTNSVCQGEQVALLWPNILNRGLEIFFTHQSFKWDNNAKNNAAVTIAIIGIRNFSKGIKRIFNKGLSKSVQNINPYLAEGETIFIKSRSMPFLDYPEMMGGNVSYDSGFLIFDEEEKINFIKKEPKAEKYFQHLMGGVELLNSRNRYCLWFKNVSINELSDMPYVLERIEQVKNARLEAKDTGTHKLAERSHQFRDLNNPRNYIAIPKTSSERRIYIPVSFLTHKYIPADSLRIVPNGELYLFAMLSSKMHMCWVKAVGGRLKTDYRYSASLCYNTFPFPEISTIQKIRLETLVHNILEQRSKHTELTLAEMYDPDKDFKELMGAHSILDIAIEQCYRSKPFESDEERLAYLFKLYEVMIGAEKTKGTLFAAEPKIKKSKKK